MRGIRTCHHSDFWSELFTRPTIARTQGCPKPDNSPGTNDYYVKSLVCCPGLTLGDIKSSADQMNLRATAAGYKMALLLGVEVAMAAGPYVSMAITPSLPVQALAMWPCGSGATPHAYASSRVQSGLRRRSSEIHQPPDDRVRCDYGFGMHPRPHTSRGRGDAAYSGEVDAVATRARLNLLGAHGCAVDGDAAAACAVDQHVRDADAGATRRRVVLMVTPLSLSRLINCVPLVSFRQVGVVVEWFVAGCCHEP